MNRRTFLIAAALCSAVLLAGCYSSPRRVVVQRGGDVTLGDMINQNVEFTSTLEGPAKLGDYITVSGQPIFLDELSGAGRYGQRVTVAGTLRRFEPPTEEDCKDGCENAEVPPHFWIEKGRFVAPSPGTQ